MTMGEEYTYQCKGCGRSMTLIIGTYSCKGWNDRKSTSEILEGKYGQKAKKAYEDHPHCIFHFQADVFSCGCGYTKSYDSLVIHGKERFNPEIFFETEHRCPRCHKKMTKLIDFPTDLTCPGCGGKMWMDTKSFYRW